MKFSPDLRQREYRTQKRPLRQLTQTSNAAYKTQDAALFASQTTVSWLPVSIVLET